MIKDITPVIIAKNAQETIRLCLESLIVFEQVILYLNNSTDSTKSIAQSFQNIKIVEGDFLGFGPTKNKASEYASNDWILSLDSDETLSQDLINTLKDISLNNNNVYQITRINYYKNHRVKHCWSDDKITRLYNKNQTAFCNKDVHEYIIANNKNIVLLNGVIKHFSYQNISQFIQKADHYSTLFAKNHIGKINSSPSKAVFNSLFSFFKTFILKRGFLDGYVGLVIAYSHMITNFYKYIKLYEENKKVKP